MKQGRFITGIVGYSCLTAGIAVMVLTASGTWADSPPSSKDQIDIGIFTAVEGKVAVTHLGLPNSIPAKIQDGVLFKDVIETDKESRTKALLNDDSILTVGEHSRVEITEHIYDPNKGVRSVVINLVKGKLRALVGKAFTGSGSKFEVHTPTAVAAARGTYFIVFHINGVSGISNIGTHGEVGFTSGRQTVTVSPGSFSIAPPGGGPPAPPAPLTGSNVPAQVRAAVQGTAVQDAPENESPSRTAAASGGTAPVQFPSTTTANAPTTTSGVSSSTTTTTTSGTTTTTSTIVSVPAVISGAVDTTNTTTETTSGNTGDSTGGDTGGDTDDGGSGSKPGDKGLHLGQLGLQPGFGNPTPGNGMVPPAVTSGAVGRLGFTPPGHGGTPPGQSGSNPGNGNRHAPTPPGLQTNNGRGGR